jgi:predicted dinucleotide-binding enzyme
MEYAFINDISEYRKYTIYVCIRYWPEKDRTVLFVAGDDAQAKSIVSKLIDEIGFTPVDTGSLREGGRRQQPGSEIYNNPMTLEIAQKKLSEIG